MVRSDLRSTYVNPVWPQRQFCCKIPPLTYPLTHVVSPDLSEPDSFAGLHTVRALYFDELWHL